MDVFGDALRVYLDGLRGRVLTIRRDDGHVDRHDPALYFERGPFAHEDALLARAKGPVLDVGCGAGRTLLWLQDRGHDATGVDISPGAVTVARARGCTDVRLCNVMRAHNKDLPENRFGTIILFGNNIGIGGTMAGAVALFRKLGRLAHSDGQMLITGLDIANTSDPHHLAYHARNVAAGRPRGEITMRFEYEDSVGDWLPWYHPEPAELDTLAQKAGWEIDDFSRPGRPFWAAVLKRSV